MKFFVSVWCVVCGLGLVACEGEQSSTNDPVVSQPEAVVSTGEAPPASAGGYTPTANEQVPGITMSQAALDQIYAEAKRNMPLPVIPDDAQAP